MQTLEELDHARRVLAQARIGITPAPHRVQRAVEAVESAWCLLGRTRVAAAWGALARLECGGLPDTQGCIDAVVEISTLLDADADYQIYRDHRQAMPVS